jgi:molybdopterin/thiamine biosynthesis adenylyltransferase
MKRDVQLAFPAKLHRALISHLFQDDYREHAAVLLGGLATTASGPKILIREVIPAREPQDYRVGSHGHMGLQATFIHRCITQCRDQRLVYLAAHNHGGSGRVAFSDVDFASHEKGYPALVDIANGMPVGALVAAQGALEVDVWLPDGSRSALRDARVFGERIERYYPDPFVQRSVEGISTSISETYSRQVLFLGSAGQALFKRAKVAVVGLGGIGSLVSEYLARMGVGHLLLIDPDRLEASNVSRIVGTTPNDLKPNGENSTLKVDIAERVAKASQSHIIVEKIVDDFSRLSVAKRVLDCDFIFLAADTMRARLVFNAIVHQYYIPGVQLGSKVQVDANSGAVLSAYSAVRMVRPGEGCLLCNQLIDATKLAEEWKTDQERIDQQYGISVPNPSVITMNAVAASHAVNDFLYAFTGLKEQEKAPFRRFNHLDQSTIYEHPRRDERCTECSNSAESRFGRGDAIPLPCIQ